jgi:hypothetical protein
MWEMVTVLDMFYLFRFPSIHSEVNAMNVRTVQPHQGISENEIVRAASRLSWSIDGDGLSDLREMYSNRPEVNVTLLYCAAKTYLLIRERHFPSTD